MNREIKFRGKGINNGEWIYGSLVVEEDRYYIVLSINDNIKRDDYDVYMFEVIPETIGQYTGIHDNFGNKIYDGDIVYVRSEDENAIIEWDDITARFIIHFDGWIADFDNFYGSDLEIFGTIYDNPELLGKE